MEADDLNLAKIKAEIRKLAAGSDKLMMETRWYPLVVGAALFGAVAAVVKLFFS